ncbi:unnamed protein product [Psylliodes chrysocephalus]|uniref:Uncharacterized protein n=1 Tax=Psylliodes chrysocephalus TaxID=3402493 RepID=A0A9P0CTQ3_9CUCU|nr:unnamed protein product [Psylliodes chrysocephala]
MESAQFMENTEQVMPMSTLCHSYIPPDGLFGQIEKVIKKTPEIENPEQYIKIMEKWGSVYRLGVDVPLHDWKSKIQIDIGTNQSLLRRGRKLQIEPSTVDIGYPLKPDKKKSISNLIEKHYGSDWRNDNALTFFKNIFNAYSASSTSTSENGTDARTELLCLEETLDFDI